MFGLGYQELLVILAILLLLFGAKRLPELGRSVGKALRGFKAGVSEADAEAKAKALPESDEAEDVVVSEPSGAAEGAERKQG